MSNNLTLHQKYVLKATKVLQGSKVRVAITTTKGRTEQGLVHAVKEDEVQFLCDQLSEGAGFGAAIWIVPLKDIHSVEVFFAENPTEVVKSAPEAGVRVVKSPEDPTEDGKKTAKAGSKA